MKSRITVITVGVDDLDRALRFYREGLGLKSEGIIGTECTQPFVGVSTKRFDFGPKTVQFGTHLLQTADNRLRSS